ncbi:MAG: non-canonical purine NTP pyrophosphatase, RdgB/HAM1 family [Gammaproteobacteria bacterium]|nr:non-canonical purine NTP pyrophosphatase, RdgB/HAM1 family [Gammaproteobacteria bacterium]
MMHYVLATNNDHKLREIQELISNRFELVSQSDLEIDGAEETGLTFVENALIKARHASKLSGLPAIADDSGLEVDALGGRPGIYSARFAGNDASDDENVKKLLTEMSGKQTRSARFQCVIVLLEHALDPTPLIAQGTLEGQILTEPRGHEGFGYDPVLYLPELSKTVADLSGPQKNQISHRARALQQLLSLMK